MGPKPSQVPPLINAGASPRGFKFAAQNCDSAFMMASDDEKSIAAARQAKQIAQDLGKPELKTFGLVTVIPGETDQEAQALLDHFNEGVDSVALDDVAAGYEQNKDFKKLSDSSLSLIGGAKRSSTMPGELVGSHETLARRLATTINEGQLDGVLLVVPDYIKDLEAVATRTLPLLAEYGITCNAGQTARV